MQVFPPNELLQTDDIFRITGPTGAAEQSGDTEQADTFLVLPDKYRYLTLAEINGSRQDLVHVPSPPLAGEFVKLFPGLVGAMKKVGLNRLMILEFLRRFLPDFEYARASYGLNLNYPPHAEVRIQAKAAATCPFTRWVAGFDTRSGVRTWLAAPDLSAMGLDASAWVTGDGILTPASRAAQEEAVKTIAEHAEQFAPGKREPQAIEPINLAPFRGQNPRLLSESAIAGLRVPLDHFNTFQEAIDKALARQLLQTPVTSV